MNRWILVGCALSIVACHPVRKRTDGGQATTKVTLAVLPAESDAFPNAAKAVTESLTKADVRGIDQRQVSKVSLEVVQLSIECVEPSAACYTAVGRSLAANRLLFAQIEPSAKKKLKVTVTLFDVDTKNPHTAEKVFSNEKAATDGIGALVAEATR